MTTNKATMTKAELAATKSEPKKPQPTKVEPPKEEAKVVKTVAITPELLASLREAETVDAAVAIVAPRNEKAKASEATYRVNAACETALPVTRGVRLTVYLTAVRLAKDFKVADIVAALPDIKSASYWTRKLHKDGFFTAVEAK